MGFRFLHTADWQIGKPFGTRADKSASLSEARLAAIVTLGELALREGVQHVLVCGDIYDLTAPNRVTLQAPLERMRSFPTVQWHLIPGNHDYYQRGMLWDIVKKNAPANIHVHLVPEPVLPALGVLLLPAPLIQRHTSADLTEWMDTALSPEGTIRIGMAHGSVRNFGSDTGGDAQNFIDPGRAGKARLDYLALGDWHRTQAINSRTWYSGTPEPDRVNSQTVGTALLVEISAAGQQPKVSQLTTGRYAWHSKEQNISGAAAFDDFETVLRQELDLARTVLNLDLKGVLTLEDFARLEEVLLRLEAATFVLDVNRAGLVVRPSEADLQTIDFGGVLRQAADRLMGRANNPDVALEERRMAEQALMELYVRTRTAIGDSPC